MHDEPRKIRILILEDDPPIRGFLDALFTNHGYEVYAYKNPKSWPLYHNPFFCKCNENQVCVDIIICGLYEQLETNSVHFLEELIRKSCRCTNLAILSGFLDTEDLDKAKKLNCKIFIKPVQVLELLDWADSVASNINTNTKLSQWAVTK